MIKAPHLLVNINNGIFMIATFVVVCIAMVVFILVAMYGGKKKKD